MLAGLARRQLSAFLDVAAYLEQRKKIEGIEDLRPPGATGVPFLRTLQELEFKKAYIVQFSEGMDAVGSEPMHQNFTISAEEMKLGSAAHHNNWPKK